MSQVTIDANVKWGLGGGRTLLHLRVTTGKVVERLGAGLHPVDGEGQVVVLEVQSDAWKVDNGLHSGTAEFVRVAWGFLVSFQVTDITLLETPTNTRPLQN
jgi:hypothetical protein